MNARDPRALDVNGLTIRTDQGRTLVSDLSFSINAGSRLGLVGESGSGKSLTALAVLGLLPPGMNASGSIVLRRPRTHRAPKSSARPSSG